MGNNRKLRLLGLGVFAVCMLWSCTKRQAAMTTEIVSDELWKDVDGQLINAHGGGILHYKGRYYWYGECKGDSTYRLERVKSWECWRADAKGVSCYSSADLVHWKFEGIVLPSVPQDSLSDLHPSQIMERPKVLYNEKTGKFVLWLHIDSPDYEKGMAGWLLPTNLRVRLCIGALSNPMVLIAGIRLCLRIPTAGLIIFVQPTGTRRYSLAC